MAGQLSGLLRPDKLVCYFRSREQMKDAAGLLHDLLDGMPAQGVPFTAELAGEGLLSWGVDPAAGSQAFGWLGQESWRVWVTNQLAASILASRAQPDSGVPTWRFALDRLRFEGVDTDTWSPREDVPPSFLNTPADQPSGPWS